MVAGLRHRVGHGDLLCTPWPPLPARTHTPHTSTGTRAEETHGRVLGGDPAVFMGISRAPDLVTLTVLLADFRGPCTNSQGLGGGVTPRQSRGQQSAKAPRQSLARLTGTKKEKNLWDRPRPQAQPPGTASGAQPSGPHLVCISTVLHRRPCEPAQAARRHFTGLFITFSPKGGPALPGPRGAVRSGLLCVSGALSVSPLAISPPLLCCPQGKERKRRGENRATMPLCQAAPWVAEPGGPPGTPGARDQTFWAPTTLTTASWWCRPIARWGWAQRQGEKSSTAPKKPGKCQWHGAVQLGQEDKGGQPQRGPWLPPLPEEAGP